MPQIIQYLLTEFLSLLVTWLISNRLGNSKPIETDNGLIFKMSKSYFILAVILLILSLLFLLVPHYVDESFDLQWIILFSGIGIFFAIGVIQTFLLALHHKVVIQNGKLEVTSIWNKTSSINTTDIQRLKFNSITSMYKIESKNSTVLIHQHIKGKKELFEYFYQKLKNQ